MSSCAVLLQKIVKEWSVNMSASQEKKLRAMERASGGDKKTIEKQKEEKKAKRKKKTWTLIGILCAILLVAIIIINSNLFYTQMSAVTIGDEEYTAAEVGFYYHTSYYNFVSSYGDYLSLMGLDTEKSLSSQSYGEDQTWAEFFREQAVSTLTQMTVLWSEAQDAGFKLNDEDEAALQEELTSLSSTATDNGYSSIDQFLTTNYGKGLDYESVAKLMERAYIAQAYAEKKQASFTYTDSELLDHYAENADRFDNFTYVKYFVDGAEDADNGIDSATAMANAKELADSILETDFESSEEFKSKVLEVTGAEASEDSTEGSSLSSDYTEWMTDADRTEGDTTVIESSSGYYVLYFISRDDNDYNLMNVRHILIKAEADDEGAYTDEAKEAAKTEAERLLAEYEEGEKTEDSFAELARANSQDDGSKTNGGLYEGVYKGQMVESFNDWCFDESRQQGDTGIVFNEDTNYCGYHVMYFVGQGKNYRLGAAEDDLRSTDYNAWYEEVSADYAVSTSFTTWFVR